MIMFLWIIEIFGFPASRLFPFYNHAISYSVRIYPFIMLTFLVKSVAKWEASNLIDECYSTLMGKLSVILTHLYFTFKGAPWYIHHIRLAFRLLRHFYFDIFFQDLFSLLHWKDQVFYLPIFLLYPFFHFFSRSVSYAYYNCSQLFYKGFWFRGFETGIFCSFPRDAI